MALFVALWSKDTEKKAIAPGPSPLEVQLHGLELAAEHACKEMSRVAGQLSSGQVRGIFLAPEYLVSRYTNITGGIHDEMADGISVDARDLALERLKTLSKRCTGLLMVPGTVSYCVPVGAGATDPRRIKYAAVLATHEKSFKSLRLDSLRSKYPEDATTGVMLAADRSLLAASSAAAGYVVRNRAYVLLDGLKKASYAKISDVGELVRPAGGGVFVPGQRGGLLQIGDLTIGVEVCGDHANGVLNQSLRSSTEVDLHVVVSAFIANQPASMKMHRNGYFLHACSREEYTSIWYYDAALSPGAKEPDPALGALVPLPGPRTLAHDLTRPRGPGDPPASLELGSRRAILFSEVVIEGGRLLCFLIQHPKFAARRTPDGRSGTTLATALGPATKLVTMNEELKNKIPKTPPLAG